MLCDICGEREAIIHRKYSGEHLCLKCLRASVEKRLRQTIGRYSLLREDDKMLLVLLGLEAEKQAVKMFLDMERGFPGVLISCIAFNEESANIAKELGIELKAKFASEALTRWEQIVKASKRSIVWSRKENFTKIVLPLLLDDAVGLFLWGVLKRSPPALVINGRIVLGDQFTEPPIVAPMFRIPTEEMMLLSEMDWQPSDKLLKTIWEIELDFPGSRFNLLNSYHVLFSYKIRDLGQSL